MLGYKMSEGECCDLQAEQVGCHFSSLDDGDESDYDDTLNSYDDTHNSYDDNLNGFDTEDVICNDETISETNETLNDSISIGYGSVSSSSFLTECGKDVREKPDHNNIDNKYDDGRDSALASELSLLALDSPIR